MNLCTLVAKHVSPKKAGTYVALYISSSFCNWCFSKRIVYQIIENRIMYMALKCSVKSQVVAS